ncbi:MAG: GntR family transcriptional regulator [Ignavibacteriales bacterium]|nr:GntR family transcriptional regulator [Ignavibacteriales bacterium]
MIELPEYSKGKMLPNEVEIAKRLGISRNTVRHATNRLAYEGLLIRKKEWELKFLMIRMLSLDLTVGIALLKK